MACSRLVSLAVLCSALAPGIASGISFNTVWLWPGSAPCNGTLQACIDSALADDTVQIATNGPISESVTIAKALILEAKSGFTPEFASGHSIQAVLSGAGAEAIRIAGLGLTAGRIAVVDRGTGPLTVDISDNHLVSSANTYNGTIEITTDLGGAGPLSFHISGNIVTLEADSAAFGIRIRPTDGSEWTGRIERNVFGVRGVGKIGI
ncbi:MAG: hypothetical protein NTZ61_20490, partial [Proteobacteria bacterium]|nr:hypothetical protein [Pseudomonadota bacterium]